MYIYNASSFPRASQGNDYGFVRLTVSQWLTQLSVRNESGQCIWVNEDFQANFVVCLLTRCWIGVSPPGNYSYVEGRLLNFILFGRTHMGSFYSRVFCKLTQLLFFFYPRSTAAISKTASYQKKKKDAPCQTLLKSFYSPCYVVCYASRWRFWSWRTKSRMYLF